ncbi:MAG TPA: orotidine-5'-phosphate decarboxylase [bacterium]|nr:orotidine-5'-phosphate decarboxylase [bacterium]HOL34387.1 orotidine-5'-phosphate decarboxylase [bacterium]HPP07952.1 orotidine-5'-phosphate decarboxylase [bacterium]
MAELIVGLDVKEKSILERIVDNLGDSVIYYKIGAIPFTAFGPGVIGWLKHSGKKVFFDLKFFDIPNTVELAVECACGMGVDLLTVHILGGKNMLESAIKARNKVNLETKIVGVTVLTSFTETDLIAVGINETIEKQILHLAEIGYRCGLDGIVCSPQDLNLLRKKFPDSFLMVCPGIRPESSHDDQKRIATPSEAVKSGADYLVIGRPIIQSPNPVEVVKRIKKEIKENERSY